MAGSVKLRMQWVRTRISRAGGFDEVTVAQLQKWTSFAGLPVRRVEGSGKPRKIDYAYAVGLRVVPGTVHPSRRGGEGEESTDAVEPSESGEA